MDIGIAIVTAAGMYVGWQIVSMAVRMRWTSTVGERQRREELEATRMLPRIEIDWKRYGDEQPPRRTPLWLKTARWKEPRIAVLGIGWGSGYADRWWVRGDEREGLNCFAGDLWAEIAPPPPLPEWKK